MYYSFKLHLHLCVEFFPIITVLIQFLKILSAGSQEKYKAYCSIGVADVINYSDLILVNKFAGHVFCWREMRSVLTGWMPSCWRNNVINHVISCIEYKRLSSDLVLVYNFASL
jgi:hypothetical protein